MKKKVDISIRHFGQAGGAIDKSVHELMEEYGAEDRGSGIFLPTGERDMQFEVFEAEADEIIKKLKKLGVKANKKELE